MYKAPNLGLPYANISAASFYRDLSETFGEKSSPYMSEQSKYQMLELAKEKADGRQCQPEQYGLSFCGAESGFIVQADYIPAKKYDDSGNLMPMEAKERPWYQGAKETGKPFFTLVTKDAHTPRLGIKCRVAGVLLTILCCASIVLLINSINEII